MDLSDVWIFTVCSIELLIDFKRLSCEVESKSDEKICANKHFLILTLDFNLVETILI